MKLLIAMGISFSIVLLTSCGSGGSSGVVTPSTRVIITNSLRKFAKGDNIQYNMNGTITTARTNLTLSGTGVFSIAANASPLDPIGIIRSVKSIILNGVLSNGKVFSSNTKSYYSQDLSGNFNLYGDSTSLWITSPVSGFVTNLKSPILFPNSWVNSYTQQNGDITVETIKVIGKVVVATGMGTFETYKIQTDSIKTLAAGGTDTLTEINYVVPSIGSIKITRNLQVIDALGTITTSKFNLVANTTSIAF